MGVGEKARQTSIAGPVGFCQDIWCLTLKLTAWMGAPPSLSQLYCAPLSAPAQEDSSLLESFASLNMCYLNPHSHSSACSCVTYLHPPTRSYLPPSWDLLHRAAPWPGRHRRPLGTRDPSPWRKPVLFRSQLKRNRNRAARLSSYAAWVCLLHLHQLTSFLTLHFNFLKENSQEEKLSRAPKVQPTSD